MSGLITFGAVKGMLDKASTQNGAKKSNSNEDNPIVSAQQALCKPMKMPEGSSLKAMDPSKPRAQDSEKKVVKLFSSVQKEFKEFLTITPHTDSSDQKKSWSFSSMLGLNKKESPRKDSDETIPPTRPQQVSSLESGDTIEL